MNQLSWILYWADVLPSLAIAIGTCSGLLATVVFLILCINIVMTGYGHSSEAHDAKEVAGIGKSINFSRWLFPVLVVLCWTTYLVPSRETFYAIAASEVGEEVLNTPEVGKARQALNTWLDRQIQGEPEAADASE